MAVVQSSSAGVSEFSMGVSLGWEGGLTGGTGGCRGREEVNPMATTCAQIILSHIPIPGTHLGSPQMYISTRAGVGPKNPYAVRQPIGWS